MVEELHDIIDKTKRYYKFTPSEVRGLVVTILICAFIISFRQWGLGKNLDIAYGLKNLLIGIIIVTISILIKLSIQRIAALSVGYRSEYKVWMFGLLLGLVLAFVSNGNIWFFVPGGIVLHHLAGHRIGFFRYGLDYFGHGLITVWGNAGILIFGIILKVINQSLNNPVIQKAILFNLLLAIYSMLPIPPLDGSRMFFGSRLVYAFSFCAIVSGGILLYANLPVWLIVGGSLLIGLICWVLYYILFERNYWPGPYMGAGDKKK